MTEHVIKKETELAEIVAGHMRDMKWEVYQEVRCGGPIADLVGVRDGLVWVVECKMSLGLPVLDQAYTWVARRYANYVSVATPSLGRGYFSQVAEIFMRDKGIGHIVVPKKFYVDDRENVEHYYRTQLDLKFHLPPRLIRSGQQKAMIKGLHEDHKRMKGGVQTGLVISPFQQTCRRIRMFLKRKGPATINDIFKEVEHHYSSDSTAKSSIAKWVDGNVIQGIRRTKDKKPYKYYLTGEYVCMDCGREEYRVEKPRYTNLKMVDLVCEYCDNIIAKKGVANEGTSVKRNVCNG